MGKLIIFEGLDGSGKGTQTKLTADRLRQRGAPKITVIDYGYFRTLSDLPSAPSDYH